MIFQDPMTSLNPSLRIRTQLAEVLVRHQGYDRDKADRAAIEMLERVGIPEPAKRANAYPHELSGGMRQRVMIAMALLCRPKILIADEPTTALDVTVQAQMLDLFKSLTNDFGTALVLITHDLGVVAGIADRMMVMYGGRCVEKGPVDTLFYEPRHPYTLGLLHSTPHVAQAGRAARPDPGPAAQPREPAARLRLPSALRLPLRALLRGAPAADAGRGRAGKGVLVPGSAQLRGGRMMLDRTEDLLKIENLSKSFSISGGLFGRPLELKALQDISFTVKRGETLGIVGESGCGKSTLGRCILQLLPTDEGKVLWLGQDITQLPAEEMRKKRRDLQIIFQDPLGFAQPAHDGGRDHRRPAPHADAGGRRRAAGASG